MWKKTGFFAVYRMKYADSTNGSTVKDITLVRMEEVDVGDKADADEVVVVSTIRWVSLLLLFSVDCSIIFLFCYFALYI